MIDRIIDINRFKTIGFLFQIKVGTPMNDLAENNLIRFKNISKKKEAIYANFKVKGVKGGVNFTASITVDISAAEVHAGDVLEKIIEECARIGVKEFKKAEFQFEGLTTI